MGIIYEQRGKFYVNEAAQPVKLTSLKEWIGQGTEEPFVVKRLKNASEIRSSAVRIKMIKQFNKK